MKHTLYDPQSRELLGGLLPRSYRPVEQFPGYRSGSIASAMAEDIHSLRPCKLVLVDSSKANLYRIHTGLSSVPGRERHVPILGTVADQCPDKAVHARRIISASKCLAKLVLLTIGGGMTRMASICLGNVLASEGSVVPRFVEPIARGGPVTHPRADFLTTDQTLNRIFRASTCPADDSIAVLQMGEPILAVDPARYLIQQLSTEARSPSPECDRRQTTRGIHAHRRERVAWRRPAG